MTTTGAWHEPEAEKQMKVQVATGGSPNNPEDLPIQELKLSEQANSYMSLAAPPKIEESKTLIDLSSTKAQ